MISHSRPTPITHDYRDFGRILKGELKAKIVIFCNIFFRKSNINNVEFG